MSSKLARLLALSEQLLGDAQLFVTKVHSLEQLYGTSTGANQLRENELAVLQQEVDKIEQQAAQLQFRLDELERDFDAPGNRFPQIEKNLRKCGRILRDQDWDAASTSSSSSGEWFEARAPPRVFMQALHVQLRALAKSAVKQQARLQEFHENLWSVQRALGKMIKKQRQASLDGSLSAPTSPNSDSTPATKAGLVKSASPPSTSPKSAGPPIQKPTTPASFTPPRSQAMSPKSPVGRPVGSLGKPPLPRSPPRKLISPVEKLTPVTQPEEPHSFISELMSSEI